MLSETEKFRKPITGITAYKDLKSGDGKQKLRENEKGQLERSQMKDLVCHGRNRSAPRSSP